MVSFANSSELSSRLNWIGPTYPLLSAFAWKLTLIVGLLGLLTASQYLILFHFGLQGLLLPTSLMGIVAIATIFGPAYGVLFAVLCLFLLETIFDNRPFLVSVVANENISATFIFVSAAMLVGVYADFVKQTMGAVPLHESASWNVLKGQPQSLGEIIGRERLSFDRDWKGEARNIVVSILMVISASIFTAGLNYVGIQRTLSFFVAAVLITAITRGVRPAMVAAILAVLASNALAANFPPRINVSKVGDLINLLTLSSVAWWVGGYADHVRHGRLMAQVLFDTSQQLSALSDETAIRKLLLKAVADVCGSQSVWVSDETGKFEKSKRPPPHASVSIGTSIGHPRYGTLPHLRVNPLQVDDRPLGFLTWSVQSATREAVVGRVVTVLADLGANAIARARLTAEQMNMQMITQGEKLRTALLSSISHDFRTPLSGILGAATGLLEQGDAYDRSRRRDLLLNIQNQAVRLNRYIENLLSMMQLDSGALNVRPQRLLIEPIVYDAWEALGDSGGALRILDVRIQEDAVVFADKFLFTQVLTNLFENAIKYTPEGSSVIVRGRTSGRSQLIEIVDTGPGVPEADLPQIFNRFYRGERPTSVGLGLGLYITRALLEAMKASVEVRNRIDGISGLIVSITMPGGES